MFSNMRLLTLDDRNWKKYTVQFTGAASSGSLKEKGQKARACIAAIFGIPRIREQLVSQKAARMEAVLAAEEAADTMTAELKAKIAGFDAEIKRLQEHLRAQNKMKDSFWKLSYFDGAAIITSSAEEITGTVAFRPPQSRAAGHSGECFTCGCAFGICIRTIRILRSREL